MSEQDDVVEGRVLNNEIVIHDVCYYNYQLVQILSIHDQSSVSQLLLSKIGPLP